MNRIVWLPRARIARQRAIDYIATDNPAAALDQLDEIERQTDMLGSYPEIGRIGRLAGTRELVVARTSFILVYRIVGDTVQILHFLHGAQQWPEDGD